MPQTYMIAYGTRRSLSFTYLTTLILNTVPCCISIKFVCAPIYYYIFFLCRSRSRLLMNCNGYMKLLTISVDDLINLSLFPLLLGV